MKEIFHAALAALLITPTVSNAEVFTYSCVFETFHERDALIRHSANNFSITFRVDSITGDAFIEGNAGISSVEVHTGDSGITFLERIGSGAVQTTTIDFNGVASHSRHTIIFQDLVPSQYYGTCNSGGS